MKLGHIAVGGAAGIMSLGLIGFGAHAAFTTTTTSAQKITSGYLSVKVSAPTTTCTATDRFGTCNAIDLKSFGPTGSTFNSGPVTVTVTNAGTVKPYEISLGFGDTVGGLPGSSALAQQVWLCMTAKTATSGTVKVDENAKLTTLHGYTFPPYALPTAGTTDHYTVEYYAGAAPTACGGLAAGTTALSTPAANPSAASLNTTAENGTITPTVTLTYQG